MDYLTKENVYRSPERRISIFVRKAPNWVFYPKMISIVLKAANLSKREKYTGEEWVKSSMGIVTALESTGATFEIENFAAFKNLDSP